METKELTKLRKNKKILAVGYKAIKYDLSTKGQSNFRYGNKDDDLIGKIFTVDGEIENCSWGLHFSKDPANVFNFYEPLGYNRYFKVQAYDEVIDNEDGLKSVARTIKFVEEYDINDFIKLIKKYDRSSNAVSDSNAVRDSNAISNSNAVSDSDAISNSNAVRGSNAISDSNAVSYSYAVSYSNAVRDSNAVSNSNAVRGSNAVSDSNAVSNSYAVSDSDAVSCSNAVSDSNAVSCSNAISNSYAIRNCEAISKCIFCANIDSLKFGLFNKRITEERFREIVKKIQEFNFRPNFTNFYELKGDKEWYRLAFPELMNVDNKIAWSKIPKKMVDYLKSLPEYDEEIFNAIVGD